MKGKEEKETYKLNDKNRERDKQRRRLRERKQEK